jgi:hypothetical protein
MIEPQPLGGSIDPGLVQYGYGTSAGREIPTFPRI